MYFSQKEIETLKNLHRIRLQQLRKGNLACLDHLQFKTHTKQPVSIKVINAIALKVCATYMGTATVQKSRKREAVVPRQITHFFARKYTNLFLSEIGWQVGAKDHATVLHSCKTVQNLYDTNDRGYFRALYDEIEDKLITKYPHIKSKYYEIRDTN